VWILIAHGALCRTAQSGALEQFTVFSTEDTTEMVFFVPCSAPVSFAAVNNSSIAAVWSSFASSRTDMIV
jgi:hypothetical protein